jgi:isochorismate pyruvate lyase
MQCRSLDEVRTNIDRIDRQIVSLLAERGGYVRQAAGFKQSMADVQAPRRVEQVVTRVRDLAREQGVDPDLVEQVYRTMIAHFIEIEALELDRH